MSHYWELDFMRKCQNCIRMLRTIIKINCDSYEIEEIDSADK